MTVQAPELAVDRPNRDHALIEVHLKELGQLFNSMDPSPFREKDLDDDAEEFIIGWAKELPADKPLALVVHLEKGAVAPDAVAAVQDAIHVFFRHRSDFSRLRLRALLRVGRTSLFIGLCFLAACIVGGDWLANLFVDSEKVGSILRESLQIGGWVAMWRPLEIFLYDWWPMLNERRTFDRLSRMPVTVRCAAPK